MAMKHGTYCGTVVDLIGKTALLRDSEPGLILAQFDDTNTGLGFNWHPFQIEEFTIDDESPE